MAKVSSLEQAQAAAATVEAEAAAGATSSVDLPHVRGILREAHPQRSHWAWHKLAR